MGKRDMNQKKINFVKIVKGFIFWGWATGAFAMTTMIALYRYAA